MRFRTAIIWNVISQFGQSGITLLSTIILARILTPDDFGIIGIVTIFIALSQMMVDSEMGGALLRKKVVTNVDYSTLFYYNLAVSLVIYAILYFSAPLIADFYSRPPLTEIVRIISITIIIHAFRVVQRIMIFRDLRFKQYAIINVASGLISLSCAVIIARQGYGYWALVWQQIALALSNVIFMWISNRFIPSLIFSKDSFKYQFSFGISLLGSDTIKTLANNISTNIIAKISTLQFTGYFTQTSRITNFCQSTMGSLMDQSIFPMLAKIDNVAKIKTTYRKILAIIISTITTVTLFFIIFAKLIVRIILGDEWLECTNILQILSLTILPVCTQILCRNIMKTLGTTKIVFYLEFLKSLILISSLLLAIPFSGVGVLWAIVSAQTIAAICWIVATERVFRKHNSPITK